MDIGDQIKDAVQGHEEEIDKGIDAIGDAFDKVTGGKFADKVDEAQDFLKEHL